VGDRQSGRLLRRAAVLRPVRPHWTGVSARPLESARAGVSFPARRKRISGPLGAAGDRAGQVRLGQVRAGQVRAGQVRAVEVRAVEVRLAEVRGGEIRAGEVRGGEIRAGKVRVAEVRAGEGNLGELRVGQARAGEVPAGEVNGSDVALWIPAPDRGKGGLDVGPCPSFPFPADDWWPPLLA